MPIPLPERSQALAKPAGLWKMAAGKQTQTLTHRRAEVEPLLVWADMMSMKALEVSENFLMSTGLGTLLGGRRETLRTPRGFLEQLEQAQPWSEGGSETEGGSAGPVTQQASESQDRSPPFLAYFSVLSVAPGLCASSLLHYPFPTTLRWTLTSSAQSSPTSPHLQASRYPLPTAQPSCPTHRSRAAPSQAPALTLCTTSQATPGASC